MAGGKALGRLADAGVVERRRGPGGPVLRVTSRFLAHAEATAGRDPAPLPRVLEAALRRWDRPVPGAGGELAEFLRERDQLGPLRSLE